MNQNIIVLKLTDGAELICTIVDDTEVDTMLVEKARVAVFQQKPDSQGQMQVQLALPPWSSIAMDSTIAITRSAIVGVIKHIDNPVEVAYRQQTSGLDLSAIRT